MASGVTSSLSAWNVSRARTSTMPSTISANAWNLPGTPAVALRAAQARSPKTTIPTSPDMISVSRWKVQKPWPTWLLTRWWEMYSFAVGALADAMAASSKNDQ